MNNIYRDFDIDAVVVPRFFSALSGAMPRFSLQDLTPGSSRYGQFYNTTSSIWQAAPFWTDMSPVGLSAFMFAASAINHSTLRASTAVEIYAVVFDPGVGSANSECEFWTFGPSLEQRVREIHQYLLAPRVEVSRPSPVSVQRSFFDAGTGGREVLRFTSTQNTSGTGPEEVQTNTTSDIEE